MENTKDPYKELEKSPMFNLSLSSKELFHSNFLRYLSTVNRESFKKLIVELAEVPGYIWPENWDVLREFNNFDLCIVEIDKAKKKKGSSKKEKEDRDENESYDGSVGRILFVLENKVKSIPYQEQLTKYASEAEKHNGYNKDIHYILLSLANVFPDKPDGLWWDISIEPKNTVVSWRIRSYEDYIELLEQFYADCEKLNKVVIDDYCNFVKNLTNLTKNWQENYSKTEEEPFLYFEWNNNKRKNSDEYELARKYRIHDLYQKIRYSYLCVSLYNSLKQYIKEKKLENDISIFPSNQGGLFKKGDEDRKKKYICVNHTYLHGEPLLEINIHPSPSDENLEICYAIQVQGGVYEHGFQVKKKDSKVTAADVWEWLGGEKCKEAIFEHAGEWMRLPTVEDKDSTWFKITIENPDVFEKDKTILPNAKQRDQEMSPITKKGKKAYPGYYKYDMNDSTYIYQGRKIASKATIKGVTNQMLTDAKKVVEWCFLK